MTSKLLPQRNRTEHHKHSLVIRVALVGALLLVPSTLAIDFMNPATAHASGIEQEMSFEGKIVTSTGQNIPDGSYNMEFRIYTGCTNEPTSSTGCTPVWTEDYLNNNAQGITFTSGTYQTALGSICSFTTGTCENNSNTAVNWDSGPLYLSLQIGNTSNCSSNNPGSAAFTADCGGDTVMNPYVLLTSSPYAFDANNADNLGGVAAANYAQVTGATFQATTNASSLLVKQTSVASPTADVFDVSGASSGNFIQVTSTAANAGAVTVQSLGANALNLQSGGALNVGTSGTESGVNIGSVGTTTSASTVDIADSTGAGVAQIVDIGSSFNSGDVVTIHAGNQGNALSLQVATNGHVQIGNDQSGTTNDTVDIGDVSGAVASDTSTVNIATYNGTGAQTVTVGSLGGTSTTTIQGGVNSTTPTLLFQAAAGGYVAIGSQTTSTVNTINLGSVAVADNDNVNINTNGSANTGVVTIGGAAQIVGDVILQGSGITDTITGSATAPSDIIKTSTNSTTAFQIQSQSGAADVMDVDTTDGWVGIGITAPTSRLTVPWLSGDSVATVNVGSSNSSDNQIGLQANSYSSAAVLGTSNSSTGVSGHSTSGSGIYGVSSSGNGVAGQSSTGASGYFQSGSTSDTQGTLVTQAIASQTADIFQVDSSGVPIYFKVAATGLVTASNGVLVTGGNVDVGSNGTATSQLYVGGNVPTAALGSGTGLGGAPWGIKVVGNYAYVTVNSTNTFKVYDVSSPTSPASVGSVSTTGTGPSALAVQGQYAYVVETSGNKLEVFNISNPTGPTSVGVATTGNTPNGIYVQGRYAYVVDGGSSNTLQVFDISNPADPVSVGSVSTGSVTGPQNVFVQGKYAYVTDASTVGFQVFNVSNPTSPSLTSTFTTGLGKPYGLYVQGKYAYITNNLTGGSGTMQILNIANPASVSSVKTVTVGDGPSDVYVQGRYAYTVSYNGDTLSTIDVSAPASAALVGTPLSLGSVNPSTLVVVGRYAYVAENGSTQFQLFDMGGEYSQQLQAGGIETGTLAVDSNATVSGDENLQGGLTVGTAADINGNLSNSGAALFQDGTNSATAFQVQNATGSSILGADTTNGWATLGTSSSVNGAISFNNATNTNTVELLSGATSASYTLALPTAGGGASQCLQTTGGSTTTTTLLTFGSCSSGGINSQTTAQSANLYVQAATSGTVAGVFEANAAGTGDILDLRNGSGTLVGSVGSTGAVKLQNSANSTTAFQIQNTNNAALINVDSTNSIIGLDTGLSGSLNTWQTNTNALTDTMGQTNAVTNNGYVYDIAGNDNGTLTGKVYYAAANTNGSIGTWGTTTTTGTPVDNQSSVVVNGYLYELGGYNGSADQSLVQYAQFNHDGTLGSWSTTTSLPATVSLGTAVTSNGYIYVLGGSQGGTIGRSVYYAKVNTNGSIGSWTTVSNALPVALHNLTAIVANGNIEVLGGGTGAAAVATTYYASLNASTGAPGTFTSTTALPAVDASPSAVVVNGYVYVIGGSSTDTGGGSAVNTVYYAPLSSTGTIGAWTTSTNTLTAPIELQPSIALNGYIYTFGGTTTGLTLTSAVYYASTARILVNASLDLVGADAGSLIASGDQSSGSIGGSLTAGNTNIVGSLQVGGQANFNGNVAITGTLNVGSSTNTNNTAIGIIGQSYSNNGIEGYSNTGEGVFGQSNSNDGLYGYDGGGTGGQGYGVQGVNYNGTSGYFQSASGTNTYSTLVAQGASGQSATLLQLMTYGGATLFSDNTSGVAVVNDVSGSAASFQVENNGTSVFKVNSSSNNITLGSNTDLLLQGSTAYISDTEGQSNSEAIGLNATVSSSGATALGEGATAGNNGIAIGYGATNGSSGSTAIGEGSTATFLSVALGYTSSAASTGSVALGQSAAANQNYSIALGAAATTTAVNQLVIGSSTANSAYVQNVYIGSGVSDATPKSATIQGTGSSAISAAGAAFAVAGGVGYGSSTGSAGGNLTLQGGNAGGSAANAGGNVLLEGGTATSTGTIGSVIAESQTNSTQAFQVQTAAGVPVFVVDTTSTDPSGGTVNYLTYPGFEVPNAGVPMGWSTVTGGTLTQNSTRKYTYNGLYSAGDLLGATNEGIVTSSLSSTPANGKFVLSAEIMAASGTTIAQNSITLKVNASGTSGSCSISSAGNFSTAGFTQVSCVTTAATTGTVTGFQITTSASSGTLYFDSVQMQPNTYNGQTITTPTAFQEGGIQLRGVIENPVAIQNEADSTNALQVLNAEGSDTVLDVDTLDSTVNMATVVSTNNLLNLTDNAVTSANALNIAHTTSAITSGALISATSSAADALSTGGLVVVSSTGNFTSTANTAGLLNVKASASAAGTLVNIADSYASQTTSTALNIVQTGVTTGYTGSLVKITGSTTTGAATLLNITDGSMTAGNAVSITAGALTTGAALTINSGTGNAIQLADSNVVDLASGTSTDDVVFKMPTSSTCTTGTLQGLSFKIGTGTQLAHICTTSSAATFFASAFDSGDTDVAEDYNDVNNNLTPGELVAMDTSGNTDDIEAATQANAGLIMGIISTAPGVELTGTQDSQTTTTLPNPKPVALSGRVPTLVSTENGPIAVGDPLTISSTPGVAMKATSTSAEVVGRALQAYNGTGTGSIEVFVQNSVNMVNQSATDDLTVNGTLYAEGGIESMGPADFYGESTFYKLVTFVDQAVFNQNVTFNGRTTFNNDAGGFAVIHKGQTQVQVTFTTPYTSNPVVTVSDNDGQFTSYSYKNLTTTGFTIVIPQAATQDINFSWTALSITNATTFQKPLPTTSDSTSAASNSSDTTTSSP